MSITHTVTTCFPRFIVIFLAALTITHLFTAFAAVFIMAVLFAAKRIKGVALPLLATVFVASWMLYQATAFFEVTLVYFIQHAFRLDLLVGGGHDFRQNSS